MMNRVARNVGQVENGLEQVIAPLASYICATTRPRAALESALAYLFREVEQTNQAASAHVAALAEKCWS